MSSSNYANFTFEREEILQVKYIFNTFTGSNTTYICIEDVPIIFKKLGLHRSKFQISKLLDPFKELQGLDFPNFLLLLSADISEQENPRKYVQLMSQFSEEASLTFNQMDKDHNGKLSPEELKEGMEEIFGEDARKIDIDAMFTAADSNHDGQIDFTEFKSALKSVY
ncbi:hypothetical protein LOD99_11717 [Oopsacas minuta]|uniref:EF-hand domain-containing protein n=1 Tax=Oopsacas minuta TaxID=111878 RepID=A0AAV7JK97_9METZ|nr:hypothetical protein LOD99_11717 [Oopsacas minuta]